MNSPSFCEFFLKNKNRPCNMKITKNSKFCPHHSHLDAESGSGKGVRIPCPFDPLHFCYLSKLEEHKKKCNAREKKQPVYYRKNVNSGEAMYIPEKVSISDFSDEELMNFIYKLGGKHDACVCPLKHHDSFHPLLKEELNNPGHATSVKHLTQQASLLGLIGKSGFLVPDTCFIEFGAGKGQLMYWVIHAVDNERSNFLLVDREARRYKWDNKFKQNPNVKVERLRIDIEHLFLGEVDAIKVRPDRIIGICKHLCGAANDLALRCLMETLQVNHADTECTKNYKPLGLVMSLCCHHRCTWRTYVGRQFLLTNDFSEREFQIMCVLSSWATCGKKIKAEVENTETVEMNPDENVELHRYDRLGLEHEKREDIGKKCKRLIDMGRVDYLEKLGLKCELVTYVDSSISLENVALVASSIC